ncbi:phosphatase inhibitor-domain-containing protein [Butyriboletus roseoflavus]|nr:phosphatase inhibitor-domain-containing protein [Butyriboletus roseoflavus]
MITVSQRRPHTSAPADGSRTLTLRDVRPRPEDDDSAGGGAGPSTTAGVLKLRGTQRRTRQRVAFGADVVDNEGCGKKKSKICCIYHKPRRFDESSSESESASASDSDEGGGRRYGSDQNIVRRDGRGGTVHELSQSDSDANAYERAPKRKS